MCDVTYEKISRYRDGIEKRLETITWEELRLEERHFLNVIAFYGDVNCNGLDSIFFNSAYLGDMANELLSSLLAVGAFEAARIFEHSFSFFPDSRVPENFDDRLSVIRKHSGKDPFDAWSSEFYSKAEEYSKLLLLYTEANKEAFVY